MKCLLLPQRSTLIDISAVTYDLLKTRASPSGLFIRLDVDLIPYFILIVASLNDVILHLGHLQLSRSVRLAMSMELA